MGQRLRLWLAVRRSEVQVKRSPMKPRTSPLRSGGRPKKVPFTALQQVGFATMRANMKKRKPRKASETTRAHGSPEFRSWMKTQPCIVCGRTPSDAAHITNGGMSRKDDVSGTVPLCSDDVRTGYSGHHSEYDGGKRSFRERYPVDLRAEAARIQTLWEARCRD